MLLITVITPKGIRPTNKYRIICFHFTDRLLQKLITILLGSFDNLDIGKVVLNFFEKKLRISNI